MKTKTVKHGLAGLIREAVMHAAERGDFGGRTLLAAFKAEHGDLSRKLTAQLGEQQLLLLLTSAAKKLSTAENTDPVRAQQLELAGFDAPSVPALLSYYEGEEKRFVSTFEARAAHLRSHMKLQDDNIAACAAKKALSARMLVCIESTGCDVSFGEALAMHAATACPTATPRPSRRATCAASPLHPHEGETP